MSSSGVTPIPAYVRTPRLHSRAGVTEPHTILHAVAISLGVSAAPSTPRSPRSVPGCTSSILLLSQGHGRVEPPRPPIVVVPSTTTTLALVSTFPATIATLGSPKQLVITPHPCLQGGILLQKVQLVTDFLQLIILLSTAGRDIRVMRVHPEL